MRYLLLALIMLLLSGCHTTSAQHTTITTKIVAEYDPDTPAPLSEAKMMLPIGNVLGWPESNLKIYGWRLLYSVSGKYRGREYHLWYNPFGVCYKILADKTGMVTLIEGPYAPPSEIPPARVLPAPDPEDLLSP